MIGRTRRIPALGPRGEGWVLIQTALLAGVVVAGLADARWPSDLQVPALVIAIIAGGAGLLLAASAVATLGRSGSPFPKPRAASQLKQSGVFALVRHPIYGGVLLLSLAWSLARSP
jgi:protein-S-isoprenylcysteine O-methyltransferase Ste14